MIFLLFFLFVSSTFCAILYILALVRATREVSNVKQRSEPMKPFAAIKIFAIFLSIPFIAGIISLGSLYWFFDGYGYFLGQSSYKFSIESALKEYNSSHEYEFFDYFEVEFCEEPILIVQEDGKLFVCNTQIREMLIGVKKYYVDDAHLLVGSRRNSDALIDEEEACGGYEKWFPYHRRYNTWFPNLWYGIVYPENRERIQVNGKTPYFHDIHFDGADYVLWYVEKDADEAVVSFKP